MNSEPKLYEISYLLRPESEEVLHENIEKIKKYLADKNGRIVNEPRNEKKQIAYPLKKEAAAVFGSFKFFLKPEEISELEAMLKRDKNFLRYMITAGKKKDLEVETRVKKVRRIPEKKAADIAEIDKKLEEILGS